MNKRKEGAATQTLMQIGALHHAWTMLEATGVKDIEVDGIRYANREQIDEAARAGVQRLDSMLRGASARAVGRCPRTTARCRHVSNHDHRQ